ncbi:hypothetical protein ABW20_dc0105834 [Dactylellina cionopaga]|nr:hypothetical protein ABW20_dc0105834 [Dactylellina cionopaga]
MSHSNTALSKVLGRNLQEKFSGSSQKPKFDQEFEPEPKLSFTDRRKLNTKELKLELSRGYDDIDCNMKRSGSFRRSFMLSQASSVKYNKERPSKTEEQFPKEHAEDKREDLKPPSTPTHPGVTKSISNYLGALGLLTPPSSLQKQREEKAMELHEQKKQSIRHLTPPRTPSRLERPPSQQTSSSPDYSYPELEWTPKSPSSLRLHTKDPSTPSSTRSPEAADTDNLSSDGDTSPTSMYHTRSRASILQPNLEISCSFDAIFENPRRLRQQPPRMQNPLEEIGGSRGLPLAQLVNFAEPNFSTPSKMAFDVRDMVSPVMMIANAFGFPHTASVQPHAKKKSMSNLSDNSVSQICGQQSKNDKPMKPEKTGPKVKTTLNVFPRRSSSRGASDSKLIEKNNPYLHNSGLYHARGSLNTQTYVEDATCSMASEASSLENIQASSNTAIPSAPTSAFDDDSSDDDYFGDLRHLSGLGARNMRRRKTNSKRLSRDSTNFTSDRPFSRFSFSSKQDSINSPKEADCRQTSTENFIPVRQIPIPEEAQLSTSAGTFNKARFGSLRLIGDNEVHHLKDGEGFDHLVLEQVDSKNLVVSGTLDCLTAELCISFETGDDEAFADTFLRASLLFTSPLSLLKSLTSRFRNANSRAQERILLLLERWLRIQPEDILETETPRELLLMFLAEASCWGHAQNVVRLTQTYSQMKEKLQAFQIAVKEVNRLRGTPKASSITSFPENLKLFFGDENIMMEVAQDTSQTRTLALWWMSQTSDEQSSWSWESELPYVDKELIDGVPERVNRLIRRSANFKFWIQHEILAMAKVEDRSDLISSLIHLALLLKDQKNLQSCLVIVDALATDIIIDLEKTWDCVPIEQIREFSELRALLDQRVYINFFSQAKDFAIPYFPFFIRAVATILNKSTNASSRYSDASKTHIDSQIETSLYRQPAYPSAEKSTRLPPILLDFKKYRSFVHEVSFYRSMTKYPPKFVWGLDRKCFVFQRMEIGRLAFPRDRDTASRVIGRMRSGSVTSASEDIPDSIYLNHFSEIVERRINAVLTPILDIDINSDITRNEQFTTTAFALRRYVPGEDARPKDERPN